MSYEETLEQAEAALAAGDAPTAFRILRPVLSHPAQLDERQWPEALGLFARVAVVFAGEEWARHVSRAAESPSDPQALYDLGYQLIEQSLHSMAAAVLARANRLTPGNEGLVCELVAALEGAGVNAEAVRVLRESPDVLRDSPFCQYLLGFNALMTTDLQTPREVLLAIEPLQDGTIQLMAATLRQMLQRADAVGGVTPLDQQDLRGWHFVVTGGVLLHLSPYGFDEGMRGRYAFVQDSPRQCLEGIRRVEAALAALAICPPRVYWAPDRASAALGIAAARLLGLPAEPWPLSGADAPGLIVAYDVQRLPPESWQGLATHRPGQVLWAHASQWTSEPPFAADLTTYLYQVNSSPWEQGPLRGGPAAPQEGEEPDAEKTPEELAEQILSANLGPDELDDLPKLAALTAAAANASGDAAAGALRSTERRNRQRTDSPVHSSRFN